jgi:RNA polymerase sigma-70 factor, ECF subfamily
MTPSAEAALPAGSPAIATRIVSGAEVVEDLELVRRTRNGDTEAFSELVRRHQQVTYNLAYRYMRDATQAEDMAQEAFLKAYRLLDGFRGDSSFSTWLYRVTSSVCLTELSRRKRRSEVELQPTHYKNAAIQPNYTLDVPEQIRRCVTKLSDRYAEIVTLYYLKGVSYDEIAEAMDIPMGTLKTWMFRARKQLRTIVETEIYADGR